MAVVPVTMGWNDVGTWEALHDLFPKDERGNVFVGRTLDRGRQRILCSMRKTAWWPPLAWHGPS